MPKSQKILQLHYVPLNKKTNNIAIPLEKWLYNININISKGQPIGWQSGIEGGNF